MAAIRRDPFDRGDSLADRYVRGDAAGADRLTIDVQSARAALPNAASELRARQAKMFANDPQQRCCRVGIDCMPRSIYGQIERHRLPP